MRRASHALSRLPATRGLATVTRYKRVRMLTYQDDARAYQLIPAYLENPDLGRSVKELIMDGSSGGGWYGWLRDWRQGPRGPPLPVSVSDSQHAATKNHVRQLGMPVKSTQVMVDSLDWWRSRIQAALDWTLDLHYEDTDWDPRKMEERKRYAEFSETLTVLLLSLCPNIKTLYLHAGPGRSVLGDYLLTSNYDQIPYPGLQRLKHVRWSGQPGWDGSYDRVEFLDILRCVHRLPQITSFSMEGVTDYDTLPQLFPPKTSKGIKEIHLRHVHLSPYMLNTILRIPVGLEKLSMSFGTLYHTDDQPRVEIALLAAVIREHKDTLRELDLDIGTSWLVSRLDSHLANEEDPLEYDDDWMNSPQIRRYYALDVADSPGPLHLDELVPERDRESLCVGSLRDLTALTRLSITIGAILGEATIFSGKFKSRPGIRLVDMLPPNLEYLRLYGYVKGKHAEWDDDVEELMREKAALLPRLGAVVGVDEVEPGVHLRSDEHTNYSPGANDMWLGREGPELDWVCTEGIRRSDVVEYYADLPGIQMDGLVGHELRQGKSLFD